MERFKLSYTRSRRQKIIITLAAIIVFVTTYALILPAITIDTDTAEKEPGIDVGAVDTALPAASLEESVEGITVSVEADAGVFPENTSLSLKVEDSGDSAMQTLLEAAVHGKIDRYEAVDISFADANGEPVAPQDTFTVKMISDAMKEEADRVLVQVTGETASVVDAPEFTYKQVEFSADANATYAVVEKSELTTEYLSADGNLYEVTVAYEYASQIPETARLVVTEYEEDSSVYQSSRRAFLTALEEDESEEDALFMDIMDISILAEDGSEVEPMSPVEVSVKRKNLPDDFNGAEGGLLVQHLNVSGEKPFVETMDSAVLLYSDSLTASFHTASFSTYSLRWQNGSNRTVTVHYGYMNGNTFVEFPAGTPAHAPEFSSSSNYTGSNYAYLIEDIPGYKYASTHRNRPTGTAITPLLARNNNEWRYTTNFSTDHHPYTDSVWTALGNGNNIYVVYEPDNSEPTQGGTPTLYESEAVTPDEPTMTKTSENNHDGTRTISLAIDGHANPVEVEKLADVIVILDVSGSMRYEMDSNNTAANEADNRLNTALDAVRGLAEDLLSEEYSNIEGNPQIRMSLITFSNTAEYRPLSESDEAIYKDGELWQPHPDLNFTSNADRFKGLLNGVTASGGTNWEQALKLANEMPVDPERGTYVIFVTDGDPTFRVTRDPTDAVTDARMEDDCDENYYRHFAVFGHGSDDPYGYNYNAAVAQASSIVEQGKNLYCIGISQQVTKVKRLTDDAQAGENHSFTATNRQQLEKAFDDIKSDIIAHIGWSDVHVTDGITGMTNLVAKTNVGISEDTEFVYTKIIHGEEGEQDRIIDDWDPESEGCNPARYDPNVNGGSLVWDMGAGFQLEDNVTYVVSFKVWPDQHAMDIIADLQNGVITWEDLTPEERSQIEPQTGTDATGEPYVVYTLKTNTSAGMTYTPTRYSKSEGTEILGPPVELPCHDTVDPLIMQTMQLSIHKEFEDSFGDEDGDGVGEDRPSEAKFLVFRRERNNPLAPMEPVNLFQPYGENNNLIVLNEEVGWSAGPFYVSTGLVDGEGTTREIGHDYFVQEIGMDYHYEHDPEYINPLMRGDSEKEAGVGDTYYDPPMLDARDVYIHMDLNGDMDESTDLTARNVVKGGLNLEKHVVDASGNEIFPDDEFTIRGYILDANNQPYLFDMANDDRTDRSQKATDDTPLFKAHQNDPIPYHFYDSSGQRIIYKGHFADTSDITFTIKAGEQIRFPIIPNGSTYCFWEEETGMPVNYRLKSVEGGAEEKLETYEGSGVYEFMPSPHPERYPVVSDDNEISGKIFSNTLSTVDFTNTRINPGSIIIQKKVTKSDGQTELYPDEEFTVSGYIRYHTGTYYVRYYGRSLNYIRRDKDGNVISTGTISNTYNSGNGFSMLLRAGETFEILNVPNGDEYRFQENALGNDSDYSFLSVTGSASNVNGGSVQNPPTPGNNRIITGTMHSNEEHDILYTNQIKQDPTELQLIKKNKRDGSRINGVTFMLYTNANHTTEATDYQGNAINPLVTGGFADEEQTIPLGLAQIGNVWPGTYYLVETGPPNGYQPLSDHVTITVGNDGSVTVVNPDDASSTGAGAISAINGIVTIEIPNTKYSDMVLPSTGGIGTHLFYISGGLLITAAAGIYIFSFRRRKGGRRRPDFL